jgi:hypothetical protein
MGGGSPAAKMRFFHLFHSLNHASKSKMVQITALKSSRFVGTAPQ